MAGRFHAEQKPLTTYFPARVTWAFPARRVLQEFFLPPARAGADFTMSIEEAISSLNQSAGAVDVRAAALRLSVSVDWIREHLGEFPNTYRLPAGSARERNVGALRVPVRDLVAFEARRRIARQ